MKKLLFLIVAILVLGCTQPSSPPASTLPTIQSSASVSAGPSAYHAPTAVATASPTPNPASQLGNLDDDIDSALSDLQAFYSNRTS